MALGAEGPEDFLKTHVKCDVVTGEAKWVRTRPVARSDFKGVWDPPKLDFWDPKSEPFELNPLQKWAKGDSLASRFLWGASHPLHAQLHVRSFSELTNNDFKILPNKSDN